MSHHKLRIKQTHAHVHHTSPMPNTSWRKNLMKSNCWVINVPNNLFSVRNTVTCIGMHTITIVLLRGKQYVLSYLFCHVICNYNIRPAIHDLKCVINFAWHIFQISWMISVRLFNINLTTKLTSNQTVFMKMMSFYSERFLAYDLFYVAVY